MPGYLRETTSLSLILPRLMYRMKREACDDGDEEDEEEEGDGVSGEYSEHEEVTGGLRLRLHNFGLQWVGRGL